jgi:hypothetical protein
MARKPSKVRQTTPTKRALYTPEPLQGRVIARRFAGESLRQIATGEGIARDTVGRILSQTEVVEMMARYQSDLLAMVPMALGVYADALDSEDLRLALVAATKILDHVFHKGGLENAALANPAPEVDRTTRRRLLLGEMLVDAGEKAKRCGLDYPDFSRAEAGLELNRESEPLLNTLPPTILRTYRTPARATMRPVRLSNSQTASGCA